MAGAFTGDVAASFSGQQATLQLHPALKLSALRFGIERTPVLIRRPVCG